MTDQQVPAGPYAFISYASRDRERVLGIARTLQAAGIGVWLDHSALPGGANYGSEIAAGIQQAAVVVLMCSDAAMQSRNVKQEIALAWKYERPYLPLLLEPTVFPQEVVYWLEGSQWVEVLNHPEAQWLPAVLLALERIGLNATGVEVKGGSPRQHGSDGDLHHTNLPELLTSFVGRQQELATVRQLMAANRLVTFSGPGGTGKTRLAIEAARGLIDSNPDGVWLVELAPVTDPSLVASGIAQVLGVKEVAGLPLAATLKAYLRERTLLLVLDNFEQVIPAAALLHDLLTGCRALRILVTSRALLRVAGEREFAVEPLPVPEATSQPVDSSLAENAAVQLFVQRAQEARRDFQLTAANAVVVAEICRRLDGLPLAIELAAARVKILSPQALLGRLERRLHLLTGGSRTLPQRQQALRDTIAWSHDLLEPPEQALFRRLAVFAGGCTLEAAEAVATAAMNASLADLDALDGVTALVDKSLVRQVEGADGEPRFTMLQTIREFALEQLAASGEEARMFDLHAGHVVALTESMQATTESAAREPAMQRLRAEQENVRAALGWTVQSGAAEAGQRIAGALWAFYYLAAPMEGRRWAEQVIAIPGGAAFPRARAAALSAAGITAWTLGELPAAIEALTESVALWRQIAANSVATADRRALARTLTFLGVSFRADLAGRPHAEEAVQLARQLQDSWLLCLCLASLGAVSSYLGDATGAQAAGDEAITLGRGLGDPVLIAVSLNVLGGLALRRGDVMEAQRLWEEALHGVEAGGDQKFNAVLLTALAWTRYQLGGADAARHFAEGLAFSRERGMKDAIAGSLQGFAGVAHGTGQSDQAARLAGAADALLRQTHTTSDPILQAFYRRMIAGVQTALGPEAFATAWAEGQRLSEDEAVALAPAPASGA